MPTLPPRTLSPATLPPPGTHTSPPIIYTPPFRLSAGRKLLVRPQQAAHPLRVGGHRGLRLRWLWLGLGSGKLRVREARLESCSGSSSYLREPQQHPYRTLTVWSRLVSATAFVAFELYTTRYLFGPCNPNAFGVWKNCNADAKRSETHLNRPFHVTHLGHTPLN